jgi:putative copper resistance protein D
VVAAVPLLLGIAGGIALRSGDALLAASWFGATGRTWRADALADQQSAGTLLLLAVVLVAVGLGAAALTARRRA